MDELVLGRGFYYKSLNDYDCLSKLGWQDV